MVTCGNSVNGRDKFQKAKAALLFDGMALLAAFSSNSKSTPLHILEFDSANNQNH
jgi:hypothetical protein